MRLLVFGGTGLLGSHVCEQARRQGWDIVATHYSSRPWATPDIDWRPCDVTEQSNVHDLVERSRPDAIVNTAYIQSGEKAFATCADGAGNVARAAGANGCRLVHVSTDLVFDGTLGRAYRESDDASPITDYGRAKVDGEAQVLDALPAALVARTSIIYGEPSAPQERLVQRAIDGDGIAFFIDEWRTPVEVGHLASAICHLATLDHSGLLHLAGDERLDRLDFAKLIARRLGLDPAALIGRTRDPAFGPRPRDVSLDCSLAKSLGFVLPGPSNLLDQS